MKRIAVLMFLCAFAGLADSLAKRLDSPEIGGGNKGHDSHDDEDQNHAAETQTPEAERGW